MLPVAFVWLPVPDEIVPVPSQTAVVCPVKRHCSSTVDHDDILSIITVRRNEPIAAGLPNLRQTSRCADYQQRRLQILPRLRSAIVHAELRRE